MPTAPSRVRAGLLKITRQAKSDVRAVAASSTDPAVARAALFEAAPAIVAEYSDGSSALALEWYDELRSAASAATAPFTPRPLVVVTDEIVAAIVAKTTAPLREVEREIAADIEAMMAESVRLLEDESERLVAEAFRDTVTTNVKADPLAVGWRRYARPEACGFCKMLADRGAVYTEATARFAAHGAVMNGGRKGGNCMCIAGPAFTGEGAYVPASPLQYVASKRRRTDKERAALREYLNRKYPDPPKPAAEPNPATAPAPPAPSVEAAPEAPTAPDVPLEDLTDDALESRLSDLMAAGDFTSTEFERVSAELDRRDAARATPAPPVEVLPEPDPVADQEALERLLYGGKTWAEKLAERESAPKVKVDPEKQLRDEYEMWVHGQWLRAEEETRGVMLSRQATARGIDERDLFTGRLSLKWASPELQEWFAQPGNQRMSYPEFRGGARDDKKARAAAQRLRNRGYESEYG